MALAKLDKSLPIWRDIIMKGRASTRVSFLLTRLAALHCHCRLITEVVFKSYLR